MPLANQLQIIVLPGPGAGDSNAYEVLHAYLHHIVSPFFDAYTSAKEQNRQYSSKRDDKDAKLGRNHIGTLIFLGVY
jgi:dynein heavy chain 1